MSEKEKKPKEKPESFVGGMPGFGFGDSADSATVNVGSGGYNENLPVAGMNGEQIRKKFGVRMEIAPESVMVVNGMNWDEKTPVQAGVKVQFIHKSGEKG